MAILDKNKNNFVVDRQENTFVGLKLPLTLEGGDISSTKTTLEAIKQNIKNLCSTELGERVMQPNLGVKLKKFLFEPFNENVVLFKSLTYVWVAPVTIFGIGFHCFSLNVFEFIIDEILSSFKKSFVL